MSAIQTFLQNILSSRYGEDVRQSIHDAIKEVDSVADTAKDSASKAAETATNKADEASKSAESSRKYADESEASALRSEEAAGKAVAITGADIAKKDNIGLIKGGDNLIGEDGTLLLTKTTTEKALLESQAGGLKVNSIAGESQQTQYSGKNLVNIADKTFVRTSYWFVNLPAGTYTISFDLESSDTDATSSLIELFATSDDYSQYFRHVYVNRGKALAVVALTQDIKTIKIWASDSVANSTDDTVTVKNFMIVEGSHTADIIGEFEPYTGGIPSPNPDYPQEIESVEVGEIRVVGKNMLNPSLLTNLYTAYDYTENSFAVFCDSNPKKFFDMDFKENTAYTISAYVKHGSYNYATFVVIYTDGTGESVNGGTGEFTFVTLTTDQTKTVDYIAVRYWGGIVYYKDFQIEEGSTATDYEPCHESAIHLSNPITLRGIGDAKDTICKQDGVYGVLRNLLSVDLGTLDYTYDSYYNNFIVSNFAGNYNAEIPLNDNTAPVALCGYFIAYSVNSIANNGFCIRKGGTANGNLQIKTTSYSDEESFKTAMSGVMLFYETTTPVFESLPTEDQIALHQLETFGTVTYLSTDSEIEPVIEVEYGTSKVGAYALKGMLTAEANRLEIHQLKVLTNELAAQQVEGSEG